MPSLNTVTVSIYQTGKPKTVIAFAPDIRWKLTAQRPVLASRPRAACNARVPTKDDLRLEMKQRLRALDLRARALASEKICRAIANDAAWKSARLAAAFLPIPGEPRIAPLWECADVPAICIPRVRGPRCDLVLLPDRAALAHAGWQLTGAEFDALPAIDLATVDVMLVPGLAFTAEGLRLGRGGGYYDRLLAACAPHTRTIGVCFATQLVTTLPTEPHDQKVGRVVTESA